MTFRSFIAQCLTLMCALILQATLQAADNELSPEEKAEGWQLLFNGQNLDGWKNNNGKPLNTDAVKDGTINTHGIGGYLLVYHEEFGDYELQYDVKMPAECNSGVFIRVSDLAEPVYTGLEIQVFSPPGTTHHDFGAIYDLAAPSKIATKGAGQWDRVRVCCKGPWIIVCVNGEKVTELNCDTLDQPGLRADGSKHKFKRAIKDFARRGYIGLQDHDTDVWYKNIKLKEL